MKTKRSFTLVELITVIVIISVLAGLILGGVEIARRRARITQAKADMSALMTALKQVETTYQKVVNGNSFDGKNATTITGGIKLGGETTASVTAYDNFIVELSDPKKLGTGLNINTRKIKILEPRSSYDPGDTVANNHTKGSLWLDPWGNRYTILINTDFSDEIPHPDSSNSRKFMGKAAIYSWGPNGVDDKGYNVETGGTGNADDITTWDN